MNEVRFLHKNNKKWEEFEELVIHGDHAEPDKVSDLYIHLTDDLAYSRTYFPFTKTTDYLNNLTQKVHHLIYRNKSAGQNKLIAFWSYEFPLVVYSARKEIYVSMFIFIIAALIGFLSNRYDPGFVRIILGDHYVNMTLANIKNGDPMAVYKSMNQVDMFLGISMNNIYISFLAFVFGILTPFGSGYILLKNGIMLGTFQGFLAQNGMLIPSLGSIWIHGVLEIFSIIVAGAAGIVIGNSIVFPASYTRLQSFRAGAEKGTKLVLGLIPVFVVAAFLEGFVTRYTHASYLIKFSIIGASILFIISYFFIYPSKLNLNKIRNGNSTN